MSKHDKVKAPGIALAPAVSLVAPLATQPSEAAMSAVSSSAVNDQSQAVPTVPAVPAVPAVPSEAVAPPAMAPPITPVIPEDVQRRLLELAVERETIAVRLEEAVRARTELESRLADLQSRQSDSGAAQLQADQALAAVTAERDQLAKQVGELQDEVLRLPEEFKALENSRAFRVMRAGPFLAMRQPLSTLLIIAGMGVATNLWEFSALASSIYIGVGGVVLLVSAIQFWARND